MHDSRPGAKSRFARDFLPNSPKPSPFKPRDLLPDSPFQSTRSWKPPSPRSTLEWISPTSASPPPSLFLSRSARSRFKPDAEPLLEVLSLSAPITLFSFVSVMSFCSPNSCREPPPAVARGRPPPSPSHLRMVPWVSSRYSPLASRAIGFSNRAQNRISDELRRAPPPPAMALHRGDRRRPPPSTLDRHPPSDLRPTAEIRRYPFGVTFSKESLSFSIFEPAVQSAFVKYAFSF